MSLAKLVKVEARRVLGIDASTNSIAFSIIENNKPINEKILHNEDVQHAYGKIIDKIKGDNK